MFIQESNSAFSRSYRFHDLRYNFTSHLIMKGADLVTVKEPLRHKPIGMTLRYAHLSPAHKAEAMAVLDEIGGGENDTIYDIKVNDADF